MAQLDSAIPTVDELDKYIARLKALTRTGREATQALAQLKAEREALAHLGIALVIQGEPGEKESTGDDRHS